MSVEYTPYVLPFIFSTIILFALAIYSFRLRHKVEIAGLFSLQNLALGVWTLCYALELSSTTQAGKIFWAKMKYFGATTGPVLWLVFSLYYTNHRNWLTKPLKIALETFIVVTIAVVLTNEFHHWYWTEITMVAGFPETQAKHGFFFWIYAAGSYLLILASVVIYINYYRTVPAYFRRQSVFMVLGSSVPLVVRILEDFVGWDPFPKLDNVILLMLLSAVLYAIALFRFSALEIVPIAHKLIVENINSGILVLDMRGHLVEINPFARELIGLEKETLLGQPLEVVLRKLPKIQYSPQMGERYEEEISIDVAGKFRFFIVQVSPIRNEQKNLLGHVMMLVDITERKHAEMELARLARTDMLTGVANRRHFFELAEKQFALAQRYDSKLAVMLLDVDRFKSINDTYGHQAGDIVLQCVAQECQSNVRATDVFARYGGEEFICLLPEQSETGALEFAERIRQIIEQTEVKTEAQAIRATASFGLAVFQKQAGLTLEQFIARADEALYQSKAKGRNRVTVWQPTYN